MKPRHFVHLHPINQKHVNIYDGNADYGDWDAGVKPGHETNVLTFSGREPSCDDVGRGGNEGAIATKACTEGQGPCEH